MAKRKQKRMIKKMKRLDPGSVLRESEFSRIKKKTKRKRVIRKSKRSK